MFVRNSRRTPSPGSNDFLLRSGGERRPATQAAASTGDCCPEQGFARSDASIVVSSTLALRVSCRWRIPTRKMRSAHQG